MLFHHKRNLLVSLLAVKLSSVFNGCVCFGHPIHFCWRSKHIQEIMDVDICNYFLFLHDVSTVEIKYGNMKGVLI